MYVLIIVAGTLLCYFLIAPMIKNIAFTVEMLFVLLQSKIKVKIYKQAVQIAKLQDIIDPSDSTDYVVEYIQEDIDEGDD